MDVVTALQAKRAPTIRKKSALLVSQAALLRTRDRDTARDALPGKHQAEILPDATLVLAILLRETVLVNALPANLSSTLNLRLRAVLLVLQEKCWTK